MLENKFCCGGGDEGGLDFWLERDRERASLKIDEPQELLLEWFLTGDEPSVSEVPQSAQQMPGLLLVGTGREFCEAILHSRRAVADMGSMESWPE